MAQTTFAPTARRVAISALRMLLLVVSAGSIVRRWRPFRRGQEVAIFIIKGMYGARIRGTTAAICSASPATDGFRAARSSTPQIAKTLITNANRR